MTGLILLGLVGQAGLQYCAADPNFRISGALRMTARTVGERPIRFFELLTAPLKGAYGLLCASAQHNQRLHRLEYLNGLSDEQLANRGLQRKDIVRHVYRNRRVG